MTHFYHALGHIQVSSCLAALRALASRDHFTLPQPQTRPGTGGVQRLSVAVPPAQGVPARAGDVQGLRLVRVADDGQRRIWNQLMMDEHPQEAGPLVGAQLRYLITSEHGWLGGFGFAAAALQLQDREQWLGWDDATRRAQLHRVVNMSRFLLRARGCRNLASMVLGQVLERVAADFESSYGYRPLIGGEVGGEFC